MSATIRKLLTYSCDIVCSSPNETLVCELKATNISDTGLTKLADILYVSELHRRFYPDPSLSNITTLSLHSGRVNTWYNKLGP